MRIKLILITFFSAIILTACLPSYYINEANTKVQQSRDAFNTQPLSRDELQNIVNSLNKLDEEEIKLREEIKKYIETNIEKYSMLKGQAEGLK